MAGQFRSKLLPKVNQFHSLIADKSMDLSKSEQVTVCTRYVNDDLTSFLHKKFFVLPKILACAPPLGGLSLVVVYGGGSRSALVDVVVAVVVETNNTIILTNYYYYTHF